MALAVQAELGNWNEGELLAPFSSPFEYLQYLQFLRLNDFDVPGVHEAYKALAYALVLRVLRLTIKRTKPALSFYSGMRPIDADAYILENARRMAQYGMHWFEAIAESAGSYTCLFTFFDELKLEKPLITYFRKADARAGAHRCELQRSDCLQRATDAVSPAMDASREVQAQRRPPANRIQNV